MFKCIGVSSCIVAHCVLLTSMVLYGIEGMAGTKLQIKQAKKKQTKKQKKEIATIKAGHSQ